MGVWFFVKWVLRYCWCIIDNGSDSNSLICCHVIFKTSLSFWLRNGNFIVKDFRKKVHNRLSFDGKLRTILPCILRDISLHNLYAFDFSLCFFVFVVSYPFTISFLKFFGHNLYREKQRDKGCSSSGLIPVTCIHHKLLKYKTNSCSASFLNWKGWRKSEKFLAIRAFYYA